MSGEDGEVTPSAEAVAQALRRCWQPVARVEDLKSGPQAAVILGQRLAVFMGESGKPAVIADRCPHRGASLSLGKVCGEGLQCAYHGWEWAGSGACLRIPSLGDQAQIPSNAKVRSYPAVAHWGLVWTALEAPLGNPPELPWFSPEDWQWRHGPPFELAVGIGLMIENFRDVAHFAFVHKDTLGIEEERIEPLSPIRDGVEVQMRRGMAAGEEAERVWGSAQEFHYHVIAPNFIGVRMLTSEGDRAILHCARAVSATESYHYWIQALDPELPSERLAEAIEFEDRVYAEDRAIVSSVEPRELQLDPGEEISTLADRFTLEYRRAFAEFVRRAGAAQRSQSTSKTN